MSLSNGDSYYRSNKGKLSPLNEMADNGVPFTRK